MPRKKELVWLGVGTKRPNLACLYDTSCHLAYFVQGQAVRTDETVRDFMSGAGWGAEWDTPKSLVPPELVW